MSLRSDICKELMLNRKCNNEKCTFIHDNICFHHWKFNKCKFGDTCKKIHLKYVDKYEEKKNKRKLLKVKNTESFEPMTKPVDMRLVIDYGKDKLKTELTDRDVLLIPHLFGDFQEKELYNKLMDEIKNCGIPEDKLLKLWHGDTHLIADDKLKLEDKSDWKSKMPTFNMIIERIKTFFNMDIKATRFNYYKDTSHFKPFHFDAAAMKPEKEKTQNFTIGVSFGVTRTVAFEHDTASKTVVSFPLSDGQAYAFCKTTNVTWRHGILQELPIKNEGRISIICWGKI